jgi:hypothetical protein
MKENGYHFDPIDVILKKTLRLTNIEVRITAAYVGNVPDKEVALKEGVPVRVIRNKRQNVYAKIGYQIMKYQKFKHEQMGEHSAAEVQGKGEGFSSPNS